MSPIRVKPFIMPRILTTFFVVILALLTIGYVLFQARLLIEGPEVTLIAEPALLQQERQIVLSGFATNITAIYLNGRPIVTDEAGLFREQVVLENGLTRVRLEAEDRYGRSVALERSFVYKPTS